MRILAILASVLLVPALAFGASEKLRIVDTDFGGTNTIIVQLGSQPTNTASGTLTNTITGNSRLSTNIVGELTRLSTNLITSTSQLLTNAVVPLYHTMQVWDGLASNEVQLCTGITFTATALIVTNVNVAVSPLVTNVTVDVTPVLTNATGISTMYGFTTSTQADAIIEFCKKAWSVLTTK